MGHTTAKFATANLPTNTEETSTRRSIRMRGNLSALNAVWHLRKRESLKFTWRRIKLSTNVTYADDLSTPKQPYSYTRWATKPTSPSPHQRLKIQSLRTLQSSTISMLNLIHISI